MLINFIVFFDLFVSLQQWNEKCMNESFLIGGGGRVRVRGGEWDPFTHFVTTMIIS